MAYLERDVYSAYEWDGSAQEQWQDKGMKNIRSGRKWDKKAPQDLHKAIQCTMKYMTLAMKNAKKDQQPHNSRWIVLVLLCL